MKLEDFEKYLDEYKKYPPRNRDQKIQEEEEFLEIAEEVIPKFLAVAKAAKAHCERWKKHESAKMAKTVLDPRHMTKGKKCLNELILELEQ